MNIEIKNPSSVYRLGVAVVAVAVLLSLFTVIMPQLSARGDARNATRDAHDAEIELAANLSALTKQSVDGQKSLARLQDLIKAFPNSFVQSQFLNLIRIAASSAGVSVESVTSTQPADPGQFDKQGKVVAPAAPVPDTEPNPAKIAPTSEQSAFPLAQVSVTISLKGTNDGIERFLALIARLERPVIIDSLSIGADVDAAGNETATATISGRTYLSRPLIVPNFKG